MPAWRFAAWVSDYRAADVAHDLLAGGLIAALLIPQALAYAFLAGLPPQIGLYTALLPPVAYALLGGSRFLAVGPTAIVAIMSASAIAQAADPVATASLLALMVGIVMLLLRLVRAGFLVNFISFPVLSGFSAGAALTIIFSQIDNFIGAPDAAAGLQRLQGANLQALAISVPVLALALAARGWRPSWLQVLRRIRGFARLAARAAPLLGLAVAAVACRWFAMEVPTVGTLPAGLPGWRFPSIDTRSLSDLLPHAVLIALVAYLEGVSVAQTLARRQRERIEPNRELAAVGAGNIGAALLGGMPVAGSFSRSALSYSAGARSPLSGLFGSLLVALATVYATAILRDLPKAALAAVIVAAASALIEPQALRRAWRYDRAEGAAWALAAAGVLVLGIEGGLLLGVAVTLLVNLFRAGRPHIVELGRVPRSEQYRELERHPELETWPQLLILRVDENLFFGNAGAVAEFVSAQVATRPDVSAVILVCSGVNSLDASALEMLEELAETLQQAGVELHLAEIKARLLDRLEDTRLLRQVGYRRVHPSVEAAIVALASPPI